MSDILYTLRMHKVAVAVVAAVIVALGVGGFFAYGAIADSSETGPATTNEVTVEVLDPSAVKPAQERPAAEDMPPQIASEGECKVAMDAMRELFNVYPSGLVLDEAGAARLTGSIQVLNADCSADLAEKFQQQELFPWMNYAVEQTAAPVEPEAVPAPEETPAG